MRIEQVNPADHVEQIMPLLGENKDETESHIRCAISPDVEMLRALHEQGMCVCLAAFDGDEVVGYALTVVVQSHPHYVGLSCASNSVLFVKQTHRRSTLGLRLIAETRRLAKARGAKVLSWHAKPGTTMDLLMQRSRKVRLEELVYSEEL